MGSFEDRKATGTVFNIQKYSVHDGPGIRTIVFLKGCPLSCKWCSNPESQASHPQVAYNKGRCIGCHRCIKACEHDAITVNEDGTLSLDRSKCDVCKTLDCAHACPAQGMIIYGENKTVDQILKEVEKDALFYARSGGGMTLSGGEPFEQPKACAALAAELKRNGYGVWSYSGYLYEDLAKRADKARAERDRRIGALGGKALHENPEEAMVSEALADIADDLAVGDLLDSIDVLVDGPFVESLELKWCGSSNQRLIDVPATRRTGSIVEWQPTSFSLEKPSNW